MLIQERYRLFKQIAQGGFSKTYLAVDEKQFSPVTCIVQQLSLPQTPKDFAQKAHLINTYVLLNGARATADFEVRIVPVA